ncbi:MAG TPA: cytochrome c-type biogenesis protein CcmH [Terriglobales bacterium]|nr:cytochrome c-type biogenesis protein CcmH [Terriglobales bacterium]
MRQHKKLLGAPLNHLLVEWGLVRRIAEAAAIAILCFTLVGAGPSTRSADARFNDLGHKLMCKCGCNQILLECNHVGCAYSTQMRDELTAALQRGAPPGGSTPDSDELVLQSFVQKYGATVLAAPTTSGFNIVAWIIPFVALVLGITLVAVIARKWKFRVQPVGAQDLSQTELDEFRRRAREETQL